MASRLKAEIERCAAERRGASPAVSPARDVRRRVPSTRTPDVDASASSRA
jgi:hypothetical protein